MEKVKIALNAIEASFYGHCKTCDTEIPFEWLEAIPTTLYCVEHAPERPTTQDRPVEEDVLIPSKGNNFENPHGSEIVDKEDSFGEVAKFGTSETPRITRAIMTAIIIFIKQKMKPMDFLKTMKDL
ncbi:hypothetical protein ACFY5J_19380 [Peribacillus butanolivorans]